MPVSLEPNTTCPGETDECDAIDSFNDSVFPIIFKFGFPSVALCELFRVHMFTALTLAHDSLDTIVTWNYEFLTETPHLPDSLFVSCVRQRPDMIDYYVNALLFEVDYARVLPNWKVACEALNSMHFFLRRLSVMTDWSTRFIWRFIDEDDVIPASSLDSTSSSKSLDGISSSSGDVQSSSENVESD